MIISIIENIIANANVTPNKPYNGIFAVGVKTLNISLSSRILDIPDNTVCIKVFLYEQ